MTARPTFADWLQGLQWDGKKRLENWLLRTLHPYTRPTSRRYHHYLRLVGRSIVLGHVARALHPGTKYDHSVLLMGPQGSGKSLLIRTLIGDEYFDDTPIDLGSKKAIKPAEGIAAYELAEMTVFRRAEEPAVKAFLSCQTDRYRPAYGSAVVDHPRQFVVWCTTNAVALPESMTHGRRLWPVYVQRACIRWLRQHRAQVFAEAVEMYRSGARITPTPEQDQAYIQPEAARLQRPAQP